MVSRGRPALLPMHIVAEEKGPGGVDLQREKDNRAHDEPDSCSVEPGEHPGSTGQPWRMQHQQTLMGLSASSWSGEAIAKAAVRPVRCLLGYAAVHAPCKAHDAHSPTAGTSS